MLNMDYCENCDAELRTEEEMEKGFCSNCIVTCYNCGEDITTENDYDGLCEECYEDIHEGEEDEDNLKRWDEC